jgi:phosphatidylserine decarboxylase
MTIHKEGFKIISISLIAVVSLIVIFRMLLFPVLSGWHWLIYGGLVALLLWIVYFFRLPSRNFNPNSKKVFSPADGKVVVVEETLEDEFFNQPMQQVSVFMSPMNVHVNLYPVAGKIIYSKYHPGKFLVAWHPKSSTLNERMSIAMQTNDNKDVMIRQIAGLLARRIVCYSTEHQVVEQCQELGFIKFGSRVDVFLPLNSKILVKPGDKVTGGITALASL